MRKVLSLILAMFMFVSNTCVVIANNEEPSNYYQEKGQFNLSSSTYSLNSEYKEFLEENPEINEKINNFDTERFSLDTVAYTKVYLKEVVDSNGTHFEPMSKEEFENLNQTRAITESKGTLTITISRYKDSWNPGYATFQMSATWTDRYGENGAAATYDDFAGITVANNYDINSHAMNGVCTGVSLDDRGSRFASYRFKEHVGTQNIIVDTQYTSYSGQRLFVGKYVHTWGALTVDTQFGTGGLNYTVSNEEKAWQISCDMVLYAD